MAWQCGTAGLGVRTARSTAVPALSSASACNRQARAGTSFSAAGQSACVQTARLAPTGRYEASATASSAATAVTPPPSQCRAGDAGDGGQQWQQEVVDAFAAAEGFVELTIRAKVASAQPWHTVTVRPVAVKGGRQLQVTTLTARQSLSANHPAPAGDTAAVERVLSPLLAQAGIGSVALRAAGGDLAVQVTKRGKGIIHRSAPKDRTPLLRGAPGSAGDPAEGAQQLLAHNRTKATPIPADRPHPFLQKIGFQTADGRVRAAMQDKFTQVNDFLRLLGHSTLVRGLAKQQQQQTQHPDQPGAAAAAGSTATTTTGDAHSTTTATESGGLGSPAGARLHILDCGCGSSHLSFGTYHYLSHVLGVPCAMAGVDVNAGLMAKSNDNAAALGLADTVRFDTAPIGDYTPRVRPDIVLALHACDTATDDALALAVKQSSPLIMAVPCCHAHLHKQLAGRPPSSRPPWQPLLRHGIMRQRQLDLVTDSLRAALLRVAGYSTDVVEFVSTEHTPRNLLIRAELQQQSASQRQQQRQQQQQQGAQPPYRKAQMEAAREYLALRDYWGVLPRLEVLLANELGPVLHAAAQASDSEPAAGQDGGDQLAA
ncbi:hypothetical protein HYH02_000480 [Chlamydomonas schloesseri]|uniref:Methyltransferase domain-containing protein n=1 Tax=Chlamydomonas schloesseri TaxID=2026947 RepID=A0A836BDG5_9CHLO|nr:hypothetical protein HYH02_000480 [Chlamydomonas schloesseri]|eukprot:KAG2454640.1 hypothetical protein HYH02_000480 [Chlamydomonas schloesseri]